MRLRRVEFFVIALTLAFVSFMGGYFLGKRGSVSIVSASQPQGGSMQQSAATGPSVALSGGSGGANSNGSGAASVTAPAAVSDGRSDTASVDDSANSSGDAGAGGIEEIGDSGIVDSGIDEHISISPDFEIAGSELPGSLRNTDGRININTASRSELMDLPGIGEVLSGRIVDYRNRYGNFSTINDIMKVSGIGAKRFEAIMDKITVGW